MHDSEKIRQPGTKAAFLRCAPSGRDGELERSTLRAPSLPVPTIIRGGRRKETPLLLPPQNGRHDQRPSPAVPASRSLGSDMRGLPDVRQQKCEGPGFLSRPQNAGHG